jgi:superfamily II DNA/RNA helicase
VAARGIDIPLLDNVINFDFPPKSKLFIHRTGRVARTGRPGKNFSLITREDMAYLIDLSLHLSRPLHAAKTSSNLNSSNKKLMSEANLLKEFTIYGSLPLTTLMMAQERYQKLLEKSKELKSYIKTCNNAYKLYCKSRPPPSIESYDRAKQLPTAGVHPLFFIKAISGATRSFADIQAEKISNTIDQFAIQNIRKLTAKQSNCNSNSFLGTDHRIDKIEKKPIRKDKMGETTHIARFLRI